MVLPQRGLVLLQGWSQGQPWISILFWSVEPECLTLPTSPSVLLSWTSSLLWLLSQSECRPPSLIRRILHPVPMCFSLTLLCQHEAETLPCRWEPCTSLVDLSVKIRWQLAGYQTLLTRANLFIFKTRKDSYALLLVNRPDLIRDFTSASAFIAKLFYGHALLEKGLIDDREQHFESECFPISASSALNPYNSKEHFFLGCI